MRLLFDGSSVMWSCLLAGKDEENGYEDPNPAEGKKPQWINSAEFGFENFINHFVSVLKRFDAVPMDAVVVFEGLNSKTLRTSIDSTYKAGSSHPEAGYLEFTRLKSMIETTLLGLGSIIVSQRGVEADDVLCYISQNLQTKNVIISNDGDLLQLCTDNTSVLRGDELNVNKYGPFDTRFITLYKALVGDPSDNIKGAKGFGPKAFLDLLVTFKEEGLEEMQKLILTDQLDRLEEDVAELPSLKKILADKDSVYKSWKLARLYPDKVNTALNPLVIKPGMVHQWDASKHDARLKQWYGRSRLVHDDNFMEAKGWMLGQFLESPFISLDIETSTPEASDEWMQAKGGKGVDVFGSELTGMGLTFGKNMQYSCYHTIDHKEETSSVRNLSRSQILDILHLIPDSKIISVHNNAFELPVLKNTLGNISSVNGPYRGFLPNVQDTRIMASYVNENTSHKLKELSKEWLGYDQTTYEEVTQGRKMNEMTALETVEYGLDDTICTAAIWNYCQFVMELEHTWDIFKQVDVVPAYLNAQRYLWGTPISLERMFELEKEDKEAYDEAWKVLRTFLIEKGWEGSTCPQFTCEKDFTPARIKEACLIVTGEELKTQVRTPSKLFILLGEKAATLAAVMTVAYDSGHYDELNDLLKAHFKGEPVFDLGSTPQMRHFLYDVLGLPVRLRNKATAVMRSKGVYEGNPKTDDFAIQFALTYDRDKGEEVVTMLKAVQTMKTVRTRESLYYEPYRHFQHWKDRLVHASVNQCSTVTRRYSSNDPNLQQLPKHPKHGVPSKFRQVYIPHHKDALVVSLDFNAQELRLIADCSRDQNMLACYVGEALKDMHSLTGNEILHKKKAARLLDMIECGDQFLDKLPELSTMWASMPYDDFIAALEDKDSLNGMLFKQLRQKGKGTNFATAYLVQAATLSERLIVMPDEAQEYIEAAQRAFPEAEMWKKRVIKEARRRGYAETRLGARRHLPALNGTDRFEASAAERQAVNFWIQGSCAEMTKLAEKRLWESRIYDRYDARYIAPIHDEIVSSVAIKDVVPFIKEKHACMVQPYADMMVPIVSSIGIGRNFGELIEIGEEPDEGKILEALHDLGIESKMSHV